MFVFSGLCPEPGGIKFSNRTSYNVGHTVTYSCQDGSSGTITCQSTRAWTSRPTCSGLFWPTDSIRSWFPPTVTGVKLLLIHLVYIICCRITWFNWSKFNHIFISIWGGNTGNWQVLVFITCESLFSFWHWIEMPDCVVGQVKMWTGNCSNCFSFIWCNLLQNYLVQLVKNQPHLQLCHLRRKHRQLARASLGFHHKSWFFISFWYWIERVECVLGQVIFEQAIAKKNISISISLMIPQNTWFKTHHWHTIHMHSVHVLMFHFKMNVTNFCCRFWPIKVNVQNHIL